MVSEAIQTEQAAFAERVFGSLSGAIDLFSIYLGDALGFYGALADEGPQTTADLAATTETHERYVREWCEQQTVTGILAVDDPRLPPDRRRYSLPESHVEELADEESLDFLAPFGQMAAALAAPLEHVVEAYRTGGGVPYADYGPNAHEGVARATDRHFSTCSVGSGFRRFPTWTRGSDGSARVLPTSAAVTATPPSGWPARIRPSPSTASTSTPRRSRPPVSTLPRRGFQTA